MSDKQKLLEEFTLINVSNFQKFIADKEKPRMKSKLLPAFAIIGFWVLFITGLSALAIAFYLCYTGSAGSSIYSKVWTISFAAFGTINCIALYKAVSIYSPFNLLQKKH